MDKLISLETMNIEKIKLEPEQNTMLVPFRFQLVMKSCYTIRPQTGVVLFLSILSVLAMILIVITLQIHDSTSYCENLFLLRSVVASEEESL